MRILFAILFLLFSNIVLATEIFEIVSLKFKDGVNLEEQKILMVELNSVIQKFEGFKSRDYFYSYENQHWIDFVVWSDFKLAKKASEAAMKDPKAVAFFSKIDEKTMLFSHYQKVGGVKK